MDRTTQESFRPLIRERLTELQRSLAQIGGTEAVAPDKAIGRLSRLDSMQMQQMALAGKRRLEAECRRLEEALERIGRGGYGRCAVCGREIAPERLEYQLDAVSCVSCLDKFAGSKRG